MTIMNPSPRFQIRIGLQHAWTMSPSLTPCLVADGATIGTLVWTKVTCQTLGGKEVESCMTPASLNRFLLAMACGYLRWRLFQPEALPRKRAVLSGGVTREVVPAGAADQAVPAGAADQVLPKTAAYEAISAELPGLLRTSLGSARAQATPAVPSFPAGPATPRKNAPSNLDSRPGNCSLSIWRA